MIFLLVGLLLSLLMLGWSILRAASRKVPHNKATGSDTIV